jgi:hypothetical protein
MLLRAVLACPIEKKPSHLLNPLFLGLGFHICEASGRGGLQSGDLWRLVESLSDSRVVIK